MVPLAARLVGGGMFGGAAVKLIRSLMEAVPAEARDARWQTWFDNVPAIVSTAEAKYPRSERERSADAEEPLARMNEKYAVVREGSRHGFSRSSRAWAEKPPCCRASRTSATSIAMKRSRFRPTAHAIRPMVVEAP